MFGVDSIPVRTSVRIRYKDGVIDCQRKTDETVGISLLWPVDGFGKLMLSTTLLPERERPYILNVELARAKLMEITLKREDWTLLEEDETFADLMRDARHLFVEAVRNIHDEAKAASLADESLKKALVYAEKLAEKYSETFLAARFRSRGLGRHSLGCRIDPGLMGNEVYSEKLFDMFGFVTVPICWREIEKVEGHYDFSKLDQCIMGMRGKKMAVCGGPLVRFAPEYLPQWLMEGDYSFDEIRDAAFKFVTNIVGRYVKKVHAWRVVSGINALNYFGFKFDQMIEVTRALCLSAKAADKHSRRIVDVLNLWGEYYSREKDTSPPMVYADTLVQSAVSFDAFGIEMNFGSPASGMHVRDMMQISSKLDEFSMMAKPVHVCSVSVPSEYHESDELAGIWHRKWDQGLQSRWAEQFYKAALGRSFVSTVTWGDLADADGTIVPTGGLLDEKMGPKKIYKSVGKIQKLIGKKS
ncbi:hypothetical protein STSP2_01837 [Anaerohalosphaera lusitana]|uniref:GH10 domain-containing protein n=2 Tax=Anaerohalosphaera lusitana TaxID=1936003 RepID=A0A1U9NLQ5_9BACT|nr:hypothetical protein STSP2_01837 [Anaerohalosphaera lusitana]